MRNSQLHQETLLQETFARVYRRNMEVCRSSTPQMGNTLRTCHSSKQLEGKLNSPTLTEAAEEMKYSRTETYTRVSRHNLKACRSLILRRENSFRNCHWLEGKPDCSTLKETPEWREYCRTASFKGAGILLLTSPLGMHKNSRKRQQAKAELAKLASLVKPSGNYWEMSLPSNPHCQLAAGGSMFFR